MPHFFETPSIGKLARLVTSVITAAAALAACSDSPAGNLPAAQKPVAISSVSVSGGGSGLLIGMAREVVATVTDASGVRRSAKSLTWKSSSEDVASVVASGDGMASVFPMSEGVTTITATADGISGSVTFTVTPNPNAVGNILIESFSVVEVQYQSAPGRWYYAPLVTMKAPATSNGGDVLNIAITIPDLGTWECRATRRVAPGSTIELFREVYGDFELTIHHSDGHRIPPAIASVEVLVRENGDTARLNASAGVKAGDFPASYTGGRVDNPWDCTLTR